MGIVANECRSAAALARELGYDRTTIVEWIKSNKITAKKRRTDKCPWLIHKKWFRPEFINKHKKFKRRLSSWTRHEIRTLQYYINTPISKLLILLPNRTKNAIKVKRSRERRKL